MTVSELVSLDDEVLAEVDFGEEPTDPEERAKHRLRRLIRSFADALGTIAQMVQDEDWQYIKRDDGSAHTSLAEMLRDHMGLSVAMANRYVQGARDLYLPLQELVVQGTPIQITAGDVAKLGRSGSQEVVEAVRERLTGDEGPDESAQVVNESISQVKEQRAQSREAAREDSAADREWESGEYEMAGFSVADPSDRRGATVSGEDAFADFEGDDDPVVTSASSREDDPLPAGRVDDDVTAEDAVAAMMAGAQTYESPEAVESLPEGLREVVSAMRVLATMDPVEVAALVDFDKRGSLMLVDDAQMRMHQMRNRVETSPWFMEMLD